MHRFSVFILVWCVILCAVGCANAVEQVEAKPPTVEFDISSRSLFGSEVDVIDASSIEKQGFLAQCPRVVFVYDDGCGHCRSAAHGFSRVASLVGSMLPPSVMGAVTMEAFNCATGVDVCVKEGIQQVPTLFFFHPKRGRAQLRSDEKGISSLIEQVRMVWNPSGRWLRGIGAQCHNARKKMKSTKSIAAKVSPTIFTEETDVFAVDIANAFFFTLYHEVPLAGVRTALQRKALDGLLAAVEGALPGLAAGVPRAYVRQLVDASPDKENVMLNVTEWQYMVLHAGIPFRGYPPDLTWRTCRGSSWRYRGFPCGMWLLYHSLTVNAAPSATAFSTVQEYVRHYFTCSQCREHFLNYKPDLSETPALQLWRVHNVANFHLARITDGADPLVPKQQFPTHHMCPQCVALNSTEYDTAAVAVFLKKRYRWNPSGLRSTVAARTATEEPRRDPLVVHVVLTMMCVVACTTCGYWKAMRSVRQRQMLRRRNK